jgi:hypothetical protein
MRGSMTGEYRTAEKGRKDFEEKSRQHPMRAASQGRPGSGGVWRAGE